MNALQPDIVFVDLTIPQPDPIVALWKIRPEVVLIGVDLATDRMLILSGHSARALTIEGLLETLTTYTKGNSPCTTI